MNKRIIIICIASVFFSCTTHAENKNCTAVPPEVDGFIQGFASGIYGAEYCDFRKLAVGDLNSDGLDDLVVSFNVEGACYKYGVGQAHLEDIPGIPGGCGNHFEGYIVVFLKNASGHGTSEVFELADDYGGIEKLAIINGRIEVDLARYLLTDSHATPTGKSKISLKLSNGKIINTNKLDKKQP